jgi:CheY-like chemotaxis protein
LTAGPRMKNILLIDDDEIVNFLNKKILERLGFSKIHVALNGQQAIDLIGHNFHESRTLPDLIFLDLSMPVMDGFEFIEAFRKSGLPGIDKIRIVVITSSQDPRDVARVKAFGVSEYLSKPVTENDMRTIVSA